MQILLMSVFPRWAVRRLERCVSIEYDSSKTLVERLDAISRTLDIKYVEVATRCEGFVSALDPHRMYRSRVNTLCVSKIGPKTLEDMYTLLTQFDGLEDADLFEDHCDLLEDVGLLQKAVFQLVYLRGELVPPQVYDAWPVP